MWSCMLNFLSARRTAELRGSYRAGWAQLHCVAIHAASRGVGRDRVCSHLAAFAAVHGGRAPMQAGLQGSER